MFQSVTIFVLTQSLHIPLPRPSSWQVHGAFAGYTGITVGLINTHYAYLPIPEVIKYARSVDPNSRMWHRCLTATGQPDFVRTD